MSQPELTDFRGRVGSAVVRAARRLKSHAGYAALPRGIDLVLTDACNLRCSYCPVPASRTPPVMMDTAKALRLLETVSAWRPGLRLFGGEPFLHPDWFTLVSEATSRGLPVGAVTNGTRLLGRAAEVVRSGLSGIGISVDPPEVHDRLRGDGTFAACEALVRELRRAREALGAAGPAILVYSTVHEGSYRHLLSWAERLRDWPIDGLRLQHRIWLRAAQRPESERLLTAAIGDATFFGPEVDAYTSDDVPTVDAGALGSVMRELLSRRYPFRLDLNPPLPVDEIVELYRDPAFARRTGRDCTLISTYAFVDPAGRLYPCLTLDMGNVFDRPFEEVWNGPRFRAFRRLLRRVERLPLCERCPS